MTWHEWTGAFSLQGGTKIHKGLVQRSAEVFEMSVVTTEDERQRPP
jgi:hypothetical protein